MNNKKMKEFLYKYRHFSGKDKEKCEIAKAKGYAEMSNALLK